MQALLALSVVAVAVRRLWLLLFVASLDLPAFREALSTALQGGQLQLARALAEGCAPAFAAQLARDGIGALERGASATTALDDGRHELEHAIARGNSTLVALGRMATPLAFITILVELGHAGTDRGLHALQRGLPLRLGLDRALDAFALGAATLLVALAAAAIVRRSAHSLRHALDTVTRVLTEGGQPVPPAQPAGFTPESGAV